MVTVRSSEIQGSALESISREMVRLYKIQFGRGPVKSRSNFAGPDALLCTLEGSMTVPEQNLVELGEDRRMRDVRTFFQYVGEKDFIGIVEEHLDRKVRGFVSGIDVKRDISSEVFYLEPRVAQAGLS